MSNKYAKDYINNVYQPHSKVDYPSRYVAPIQYDQNIGAYYNERPNWLGGETESLSQGMANYIFQPLGWRP